MNKHPLLIIFFCLLTLPMLAQKKLSVVYTSQNRNDTGFIYNKQLLAINDSVSFQTTTFLRGKDIPYSLPLGSGFGSHNTYIDHSGNLMLTQSQPHGRSKQLIEDTVHKSSWKLLEGEKEILGFRCKKAVNYDHGYGEVVWYAPSIPLPFGPGWLGGLPGVILEVNVSGSPVVIIATQITQDAPEIVEPTEGKRISAEKFRRMMKGNSVSF